MLTRTELRGILQRILYQIFDKWFPLVAAFTEQSTECTKAAPMMRPHTSYCEIAACVAEHMGQRSRVEGVSGSLQRRGKKFRSTLVYAFNKHCDCGK